MWMRIFLNLHNSRELVSTISGKGLPLDGGEAVLIIQESALMISSLTIIRPGAGMANLGFPR